MDFWRLPRGTTPPRGGAFLSLSATARHSQTELLLPLHLLLLSLWAGPGVALLGATCEKRCRREAETPGPSTATSFPSSAAAQFSHCPLLGGVAGEVLGRGRRRTEGECQDQQGNEGLHHRIRFSNKRSTATSYKIKLQPYASTNTTAAPRSKKNKRSPPSLCPRPRPACRPPQLALSLALRSSTNQSQHNKNGHCDASD